MLISSILIKWYLQNKRNLPWRNTVNPYHIWVSEVILQQTKVAQGIGYYKRFIHRFPDIKSLANADITDVLKSWQGLGYYTRARNLHKGANFIMKEFFGQLPCNFDELLRINGVGEYTAAAIGSIAFNLPVAVVDGNVNRVIARYYGIHDPINSPSGIRQIKEIAGSILDKSQPSLHNQAMMELGALQCVAQNPDCSLCPLSENCYARLHEETGLLPVKLKLSKMRTRHFNYLVLLYSNHTYLCHRDKKDIWQGLYEFPLIETDKAVNEKNLKTTDEWLKILEGVSYTVLSVSDTYQHQLTHQKIHAKFYTIRVDHVPSGFLQDGKLIRIDDFGQYPIPKLIENFVDNCLFLRYQKI
jgi:A/G-specific adenine glycosylase